MYWVSGVITNIVCSTISGGWSIPYPAPNSHIANLTKVYVSRSSHSSKPHSLRTLNALQNPLANPDPSWSVLSRPAPTYTTAHHTYTHTSPDDVFYETASRSYSDALEGSGVPPLLTSSNSIHGCLDSTTALLSFKTAMWECLELL